MSSDSEEYNLVLYSGVSVYMINFSYKSSTGSNELFS